MVEITIFTSEGEVFNPKSDSTEQSDEILDWALAKTELIVNVEDREVIGYFNAAETEFSRTEQFYAQFVDQDTTTPLFDFKEAVENKMGSYGYSIRANEDESILYQQLPGETIDLRSDDIAVVSDTLDADSDKEYAVVGVPSMFKAVGLTREFGKTRNVAITKRVNGDTFEEIDLIFVVGDYDAVERLGENEY